MRQDRAAARKWIGLGQGLLIVAANTLFLLAALEGLARLAGQRPCAGPAQQGEGAGDKIRYHPVRQYELVPGSTFTFEREVAIRHGLSQDYLDAWERITYRINSLGCRGAEVSALKSADTFRILLLGDSVAFGWGIEEQDTIACRLQQRLNQSAGGRRYEVWNCGVPGFATWQELSYLAEKGPAFRPDLVVLPFLFNDVDGNNEAAQMQLFGMGTIERSITLLTHKSALLCFLRDQALQLRLKKLKPCQGPNCWDATERVLDGLAAENKKLGSRLVLVAMPMRRQLEPDAEPGYYDRALGDDPQANYQDIIARLCRERNIAYLDLLPAFQQAMAADPRTLFLDADHPNAQGCRVAAEAIYRFLQEGR